MKRNRFTGWRWLYWLCAVTSALFVCIGTAFAGTLTKATLEVQFPAPLVVGEKSTKLPVWPIFRKGANDAAKAGEDVPANEPARAYAARLRSANDAAKTGAAGVPAAEKLELVGWVFESIDLEPIRGYSGKPINIMVLVDQKGNFLDVKMIEHKEPLFVSEFGTEILAKFARQYKGLSLQHNITIIRPKQPTHVADGIATVNGIAAGTVTAIAMERSILESALKVAQADLGGSGSARVPRGQDRFEAMPVESLVQAGFLQNVKITHQQIERPFIGTLAAGLDDRPGQQSDEAVIDATVGMVSLTQVGKNFLIPEAWAALEATKNTGELTFMVTERGRYRLLGNEKKPVGAGSVAARLKLRSQANKDELIDVRELPFEHAVTVPDAFKGKEKPRFFTTVGGASLDLYKPLTLAVQVTREVGFDPVKRFQSVVDFPYAPPTFTQWLGAPSTATTTKEFRWLAQWKARAWEIGVLLVGLIILTIALAKQHWLTAHAKRLARFRFVYLVFTLGFIGWFAQGQLTIVNITALIEAVRAGESAEFLLNDPFTVILWPYTFITLFIWGRGTFCGWLCPFGALQELIAQLGDLLRIKKIRLRMPLDAKLKWIKYGLLAIILICAFVSGPWTERTTEIEPFKTAISLYFVRAWPYVLWAVACVALSVLVFRGYCRYICPLGAALAVLGKVRIFNWIPRKAECGTPCQTCRHGCGYQAIAPVGKIDYDECFQCLDCVSIYQDKKLCLPLVRKVKAARVIPIAVAIAPAGAST